MVLNGLAAINPALVQRVARDPETVALAKRYGVTPTQYAEQVLEQETGQKGLGWGFSLPVPSFVKKAVQTVKKAAPSRASLVKAGQMAAQGAAAYYTGGASMLASRLVPGQAPTDQGVPSDQYAVPGYPAPASGYAPGMPVAPGQVPAQGFLASMSPTTKILAGVALVGIPLAFMLMKRRNAPSSPL